MFPFSKIQLSTVRSKFSSGIPNNNNEEKEGRNKLEGKVGQEEEKEKTKKMVIYTNKKPEDEEGKKGAIELHHGKISMKELRITPSQMDV